MVAAHAPAFVGHQVPDRQEVECALLLDANHAFCHVLSLLRFDTNHIYYNVQPVVSAPTYLA